MYVLQLQTIEPVTYLFMVPSDKKNHTYMSTAIKDCIAPAMLRVREELVRLAVQDFGEDSQEAKDARATQIVLSFDGEETHLVAAIDQLCVNTPAELKDKGFVLVKFAASASKTQQPCDVSPAYRTLKAQVKDLLRCPSKAKMSAPSLATQLDKLLESVPPASRKTFKRIFNQLPGLLSKSLSRRQSTTCV